MPTGIDIPERVEVCKKCDMPTFVSRLHTAEGVDTQTFCATCGVDDPETETKKVCACGVVLNDGIDICDRCVTSYWKNRLPFSYYHGSC